MSQLRDEILNWAASGRLKPADAPRALEIGGLTPQLSDWRTFLQTLLLWTGSVLGAAGVIFFFAYNWRSLHRFGKFALAETVFAAAVIAAWRLGTERLAGKAALCGAALLTGALLALLGQIYQTTADTYELFAFWAVLILPWVIAARFAPLWLMWIGLINLSVTYFDAVWGTLWALFGIDTLALAAWELGLQNDVPWLNRWGARLLAVLSGSFATIIGVFCVFGPGPPEVGKSAILAYFAWVLVMYLYYQFEVFDVFMLAGTHLSAIVIVTAFLVKPLLENHLESGKLLLIGLVVIGMSGAGVWWIHRMLKDRPA